MKVLILISCIFAVTSAQLFTVGYPGNQFNLQQQQQFIASQQGVSGSRTFYAGQQHVPVIGPLGVPVEPREVQAAKAAHLDILARQNARTQTEGNQGQGFNRQFSSAPQQSYGVSIFNQNAGGYQIASQIPQAQIRLNSNGVVQDTPEVALAKAQHFSLFAKQAEAAAKAKDTSVDNRQARYNGIAVSVPTYTYQQIVGNNQPLYRQRRSIHYPQHIPIIGKDGVPLDTPEVQHARAQHHLAHEAAKNKQHHSEIHIIHPIHYQTHYHHQHIPVIGPKGVPIDTPEVQHARAEHLRAHAQAKLQHALKYTNTPIEIENREGGQYGGNNIEYEEEQSEQYGHQEEQIDRPEGGNQIEHVQYQIHHPQQYVQEHQGEQQHYEYQIEYPQQYGGGEGEEEENEESGKYY